MPKNRDRQGYVLVVEDEEDNLELLGRLLHSDVHLWVARNAMEARKILAENQVDLIIADHRLPGETGAALLRAMVTERPNVGRFLVTAYSDGEEVAQVCREGTVDRLFLKPYSPMRLKGAVLEHLRRFGLVKPRALIVDDDADIRTLINTVLANRSVETVLASDGVEAISRLDKEKFDIAIVDLNLPGIDGSKVLEHAQKTDPHLPVIVLTAHEYAIGLSFLQGGAFDFLSKPFKQSELIMRAERALLAHQQELEHQRLLGEARASQPELNIVARSVGMKCVMDQATMVAGHDVNVLISGETGTGKEVVARAIHQASRRAKGPFIPVNCGALPETLADSELFGHEKGSFTDAKDSKPGIFRSADGGTVFLDEIGELSPQSQVRLLRVLETKEVMGVGSTKPVSIDVRVVTATHRDLESMISENRFRRDLFYRLNAFRIDIPPLRDRKEDIPPLIELAVAKFCAQNQLPMAEITANAITEACAHRWPGNVRELYHCVERVLIAHGPKRLDTLDLGRDTSSALTSRPQIDADLPMRAALEPVFDDLERQYLVALLDRCGGHLGRAAKHAGIHRKSLYNKLKRHGLSAKDR